jgi:hypothetical protein
MTVLIITSGSTFVVPFDWTSVNQIETWAGGGGTGGITTGEGGGGGGGYSSVSNQTGLTGTLTIQVGVGGSDTAPATDTWFNGSSVATSTVGSNHGSNSVGTGLGAGGSTVGAVGTTKFAGANGGTQFAPGDGGGGGGGAGGPDGAGVAGTNGGNVVQGANGGAGDNSLGGAGGAGGSFVAVAGSPGGSVTAGGGGGGGGGESAAGGNGGFPGGGAGGAGYGGSNGGITGGAGQIRVTYTPTPPSVGIISTDLPVYRRKPDPGVNRDFSGWQRSPLAASGPPGMALGFTTEVPYNTAAQRWRQYDFSGYQFAGPNQNFVSLPPPAPWYEVPRGLDRHSDVSFLSGPGTRSDFSQPPTPWVEVPRSAITRFDYTGLQKWQMPADVQPGLQSSRSFDLPVTSRTGLWARYVDLWQGSVQAPRVANVIPGPPHTWLPLTGVGSMGP